MAEQVEQFAIYLASPWNQRREAEKVAARLEEAGYLITRDWWNDTDSPQVSQAWNDLRGVAAADCVIVLQLEKSEGKAVETGYAMALDIPVIVVREDGVEQGNVFQTLAARAFSVAHALEIVEEIRQKNHIARANLRVIHPTAQLVH